MLVSLYRILKFAFQDFFRNFLLSVITIFVLILTLSLVNLLIIFNIAAKEAVKMVEDKIDITVYFKPAADETKINLAREEVKELPQVQELQYFSREDALKEYKEINKNNSDVLAAIEELDQNPFGAFLIIKTYNPKDYTIALNVFNQEGYKDLVENTDYQNSEMLVNKVINITDKAERAGQVLIVIFLVISVLIVINTVRMAIYNHQNEIKIMKSVGATNWFVKLPYLVESVLYSIIAIGFAIGLVYLFLHFVEPYLTAIFNNLSFMGYYNDNFNYLFGWQLIGAIVLTVFSSSYAINRYLSRR